MPTGRKLPDGRVRNPDEEHFFLVLVALVSVPLPYGPLLTVGAAVVIAPLPLVEAAASVDESDAVYDKLVKVRQPITMGMVYLQR